MHRWCRRIGGIILRWRLLIGGLKMPRSHHDSQVCWPICVSLDGDARFTGVDLILWLGDARDVIRRYSCIKDYICKSAKENIIMYSLQQW